MNTLAVGELLKWFLLAGMVTLGLLAIVRLLPLVHMAWLSLSVGVQNLVGGTGEQLAHMSRSASHSRYRQARKREVFESLQARTGGSEAGAVDQGMVEAKRRSPMLRRLVTEAAADIRSCVRIHRLSALAGGAVRIEDVAWDPYLTQLRERVVDVLDIAVEQLEQYPYVCRNDDLARNMVVLRSRVKPTCEQCPYLAFRVDDPKVLCPSAEIVGVKPEEVDCHDCTT